MSSLEQPLVSVVIPCYNHENFVQDCIQSVLDQTYQNIELIIIDDGSKDNSISKIEEMVEKCEKRFVRFEFRHRKNKGLSATLNEALEWCQGEYYSAIASDDLMTEKKTEKQVYFLQENLHVAAVFGGVELINDKNEIVDIRVHPDRTYTFKEIILNKHDLPASTQMARLKLIKDIGGYNTDYKIEDWYMLLKMAKKEFDIVYMKEVFCSYRFHENNFSKNMEIMGNEMKKIIAEYKDNIFYKEALKIIYKQEFNYFKNKKDYIKAFNTLFKFFIVSVVSK